MASNRSQIVIAAIALTENHGATKKHQCGGVDKPTDYWCGSVQCAMLVDSGFPDINQKSR